MGLDPFHVCCPLGEKHLTLFGRHHMRALNEMKMKDCPLVECAPSGFLFSFFLQTIVLIMALHQRVSPIMSCVSFGEEVLPFLDALLSATMGW